jgi:hypothetical protein
MKRHLFYGIIFLLAGGIILTTCNKEYFEFDRLSDEIELQPDLVAPLIHGSMSVQDLVEMFDSSGYAHEFDDGLIYLAYSDTLIEIMADTVVEVPDHLVTEAYIDLDIDIPVWIGSAVGDTIPFYKSELFSFTLEGNDRMDSVLVKGGEIILDVVSSFEHTGLLTISSSQILDVNRDTFFTVFNISDLTGNFSEQQTVFSDGYCLKSTEVNDTSYIQLNYKLELINSGNPINPDDAVDIMASFENLDFYSVFGYIDSRSLISESGSVEIPIYANNPDLASLTFADPRINIFTYNSVGIPFEVTLDSVIGSADNGTTDSLEFYSGHPFVIPAPNMGNIGATVDGEFNINKETSNINELLEIAPSTLSYKVTGRTEPGTEEETHFILDTSRFMLAMEFLLPLDFKSSGFALEDTLEFEVGEEGVDTSMIKLAQVSITTVNELPIEFELQLYLLDASHSVIDSVFDGNTVLLGASLVDSQGLLMEPTEETNIVTFPAEKLGKLKDVFYMEVQARMITSELGQQYVKLYSHYSLNFEISLSANLRINTRELN